MGLVRGTLTWDSYVGLLRGTFTLGWALLGVKIETSMNRLATFHKVGPAGRGEHYGEKSFRIGSLICPAVRARSYAKMGVAQEGRRDFWLMANWGSLIPLVG